MSDNKPPPECPAHGATPLFTPPWPKPHHNKASLPRRFISAWGSWIDTLFEKSYTMQMGEVHLPNVTFYIANDPKVVDEVLEDRQKVFPKHKFLADILKPAIGNSVFVANGKEWEDQRQMVNPAFQHTNLKRVFPMMRAAVDDLLDHIDTLDQSKPIEVDPLMTFVAADIIYRTIFSVKLDQAGAERIYESFGRFARYSQPASILRAYRLPTLGFEAKALKAAADVHAVFAPLVRERFDAWHAGTGTAKKDILQPLLEAKHPETGEPFNFRDIMEQISLIFLAGHETAASALTWGLYLLSECPHLQDSLAAEIETVTGGKALGFDHLKNLGGIRNLFKETMRLYPPISFLMREITRPTPMRDKLLKKGAMIVVSPWIVQRHADNWKCPHAFMPDRFDDPEQAEAAKRAYMPFGRGARICIGAGFASQEGMIVLASIVRKFRLRYPGGPKPKPIAKLTLRPKNMVKLFFERR